MTGGLGAQVAARSSRGAQSTQCPALTISSVRYGTKIDVVTPLTSLHTCLAKLRYTWRSSTTAATHLPACKCPARKILSESRRAGAENSQSSCWLCRSSWCPRPRNRWSRPRPVNKASPSGLSKRAVQGLWDDHAPLSCHLEQQRKRSPLSVS